MKDGDRIALASDTGRVEAIAHPADDIREGVASLAPCFTHAAPTSALVSDGAHGDPISGMPRMSPIPIRVSRI